MKELFGEWGLHWTLTQWIGLLGEDDDTLCGESRCPNQLPGSRKPVPNPVRAADWLRYDAQASRAPQHWLPSLCLESEWYPSSEYSQELQSMKEFSYVRSWWTTGEQALWCPWTAPLSTYRQSWLLSLKCSQFPKFLKTHLPSLRFCSSALACLLLPDCLAVH